MVRSVVFSRESSPDMMKRMAGTSIVGLNRISLLGISLVTRPITPVAMMRSVVPATERPAVSRESKMHSR